MIFIIGVMLVISFPCINNMLTAKQKVILAREKKNAPLKHISLEMETSTHFPLLIAAVQRTQGKVIELGSGLFSTPLLHWLLFGTGRELVTYESFDHYFQFAKKFQTPWHDVRFVKDWEKEVKAEECSVVLIDHTPKKPRTRGDDALVFKDSAHYVILHDAGHRPNPKYGYEKVYPHFKYRSDWTECLPHTTILSNRNDMQWCCD